MKLKRIQVSKSLIQSQVRSARESLEQVQKLRKVAKEKSLEKDLIEPEFKMPKIGLYNTSSSINLPKNDATNISI
jgi:hypothetical protein